MTNFLNTYLTEYDDSLSGDSYIDPIGTLIVWSALGRQVFGDRVNSVSNDVRNYTLNLFHHHLVRRLVLDDRVQLNVSLRRQYGDKSSNSATAPSRSPTPQSTNPTRGRVHFAVAVQATTSIRLSLRP